MEKVFWFTFCFPNSLEDGTGSTLDFLSSPIFQSFSAVERHQVRHEQHGLSGFLANIPKEAACIGFIPHKKQEKK